MCTSARGRWERHQTAGHPKRRSAMKPMRTNPMTYAGVCCRHACMYVRFRQVNFGCVDVGVRCHWKAQWFATALLYSLLGAGLSCFKFLVISLIHLSLGPESAMPVPWVAWSIQHPRSTVKPSLLLVRIVNWLHGSVVLYPTRRGPRLFSYRSFYVLDFWISCGLTCKWRLSCLHQSFTLKTLWRHLIKLEWKRED